MSIEIKTFWWNENNKPSVPVRLAKVPVSKPNTTGLIAQTTCGQKIALMGERRVAQPEPGYRYHEFRYSL